MMLIIIFQLINQLDYKMSENSQKKPLASQRWLWEKEKQ